MSKKLLIMLMLTFCIAHLGVVPISAAKMAPEWKLIEPAYETADTFVAAYSVRDFGALGDGETDVTAIFQQLLDELGKLGGGTLFVPEGKYAIKGSLLIPKGVTLRGEWSKPVRGQPVKGTILMAYAGRGDEKAAPLVTMEPSSAIRDLSIWYPEQLPDQITPYPPAIVFGKPNYFGNDFCNAKNITFVNAYTGLMFSRENGGSSPVLNGLYGTPLSRGVEIDNIADVGRIEWIDFSPDYWSGSGLPNAPAAGSAYEQWIYENGTGIVMRRNDWSYTGYITIDGYNRGFHLGPSIASPGSIPNGHNYELTFTGNKTAIYAETVSGDGVMFTRVHIQDSETGIAAGPATSGVLQLNGSDINASLHAIAVDPTSQTKLIVQQSTIAGGDVAVAGGTLMASDSDFNNAAPQIRITDSARAILTGNRFSGTPDIEDTSKFISAIDHSPVNMAKLPAFPDAVPETHKPARMTLYVATEAPFRAKNDGKTDNTAAIQAALDKAAAEGGGVVFLPPGKYKVLGHLTVPTGVELKGSVDNSTVPTGPGSVLEAYADRNNPKGEPFLKLSERSGVRGITINYPEQLASQLPNIASYPYTVQAAGKDVYMINVGLRAVYNGVDLFTHKADNHYLDYVTGHVFRNGVKVGGGSEGGKIYNMHFNQIVYAAGSESKFGEWPNAPSMDNNKPVYEYGYNQLDFMILGDVKGEILYNNFHYGSRSGLLLVEENGRGPTGISVGLGVDGAQKGLVFENAGEAGFDLINSQIVSIDGGEETRYVEIGEEFASEIRFYSADFWGAPMYGVTVDNGNLKLQAVNFRNPGDWGFAKLMNEGKLYLDNSVIGSTKALLNAKGEPKLFAQSSIINSIGTYVKEMGLWKNNQTHNAFAKPAESTSKPAPAAEEEAAETPAPTEAPAQSDANTAVWNWVYAGIGLVVVLAAVSFVLIRRYRGSDKPDHNHGGPKSKEMK
ncbi:glycosyl hydrolase family 28-related protein [Paenibacillus gorillae]|uniref:glycosyl hydrolase family 28-related protein n=2 Tax=Bacillota TaxID=1239 RepID=UPI0004ADC2BD|nr:glycosyl hydrolase family 28-related protein [Paenibacillus gorillae]